MESITRREFFADLIATVGAALGLGALAFRFAAFLYPVVPPVRLVEVLVARRRDIPEGGARLFNVDQADVIILDDGTRLRAFSAVCTHLGCIIHWDDKVKRFICPCHNGVFDANGKVVSGPPPRPLDEFNLTVRGEDVFVLLETREEQV